MSSIVKANLLVITGRRKDDLPENRVYDLQENYVSEKSKKLEDESLSRAEVIIAEAEKNSKEIMYKAEMKGYDDGYLRGLVDGSNQAYKAAEEGIEEIRNVLDLINKERERDTKKEEKNLLAIAFEISKKIMRHSVQMDEKIIENMLEEVIAENDGKIKITISEYQKTLDVRIDRTLAKKIKNYTRDSKIIFVKEEDVIIVETVNGVVDLSIPVQIARLEKAVEDKL